MNVLIWSAVSSRDSSVSLVFRLWAGRSGIRIPAEARDFSFLFRWSTESLSLLFELVPGLFAGKTSDRNGKLITCLYIVPKLRMSGPTPLLTLYACMASARTTFTFAFSCSCRFPHLRGRFVYSCQHNALQYKHYTFSASDFNTLQYLNFPNCHFSRASCACKNVYTVVLPDSISEKLNYLPL